ncbi:MAG: nucleotidyltransferase domain-containing protein [archaeon]
MKKKIEVIIKKVLEEIEPPKEEIINIENSLREFIEKLKERIRKTKINADIFVGGSYAKKTLIKKGKYDIDIFLRFEKNYKGKEISYITKKILEGFTNLSEVHGSRNYFRVDGGENFFFEIIPVIKIKKPEEAENITDLSYSHVQYIKKRLKSKKIIDDVKTAKAFCYAKNCYGAESYIKGFSGYGIELLIHHYQGFLNFIRAISKIKEKEIIDIEKLYKNKQRILLDLNSSKLESPVILIDPTYKQRNALAALSYETFERFKKECSEFLKNPSIESFSKKKIKLKEIKKGAEKKGFEFILIEAKTEKQNGDIAGGKLLKFYNHLASEIEKFFEVKNKGFNYSRGETARYFFVAKRKKEITVEGPSIKDLKNVSSFRKKHKNTFEKKGRIYAKEKINFSLEKFFNSMKKKDKKRIKEMYISDLKKIKF